EGTLVGATEGTLVGATEGTLVGATEGTLVGATEGATLGLIEPSALEAGELPEPPQALRTRTLESANAIGCSLAI
ncbi:hypothetical protein, partial [Motilimonas sp. E26]|uniref:hypothetical protein n=1 Tax=Motilimonas sp. E26 TaxID=2865674 RepID=UPI001E4EFF82